jgi:hypothetical protein
MDSTTAAQLISPLVAENIRTSPVPASFNPFLPAAAAAASSLFFLPRSFPTRSFFADPLPLWPVVASLPPPFFTSPHYADFLSLEHNTKILTRTHAQTSLILGLGAGILALSAWQGFLFYIIGYILVTLAIVTNAPPNPTSTGTQGTAGYFKSYLDVWSQEVFNGLLSFVLSWTLSFALVHGMALDP